MRRSYLALTFDSIQSMSDELEKILVPLFSADTKKMDVTMLFTVTAPNFNLHFQHRHSVINDLIDNPSPAQLTGINRPYSLYQEMVIGILWGMNELYMQALKDNVQIPKEYVLHYYCQAKTIATELNNFLARVAQQLTFTEGSIIDELSKNAAIQRIEVIPDKNEIVASVYWRPNLYALKHSVYVIRFNEEDACYYFYPVLDGKVVRTPVVLIPTVLFERAIGNIG